MRLSLARALIAAPMAVLTPLVAAPAESEAQSRNGSVSGVVRDSARAPIPGADVWMIPGGRRTRSDSAGRYTLGDVDNGSYTITARKLGFASETWDAKLSDNGQLEINFALRRRPQLDTVRVVGQRGCDGFGVTGFECRRGAGGGVFLDYPDIDAKERLFVADLFRDIPGFRVMPSRSGPARPVVTMYRPYRCIASFVNGLPAGITNPIPERTSDLVALEIYRSADSVPLTKRSHLRRAGSQLAYHNCGVVLYWTPWARVDEPPNSRLNRILGARN